MRTAGTQWEITEEDSEEIIAKIDPECDKDRIRRIIAYQKSLYPSSFFSTSNFALASRSNSFCSSSRRSSLLELMKAGGRCLSRLFDMEHTTLAAHLKDYSASPVTKPLFLWGSDSGDRTLDLAYWSPVKSFRRSGEDCESNNFNERRRKSDTSGGGYGSVKKKLHSRQKLVRKRSYKTLPGFKIWRHNGLRLRLRRLKIIVCGEIANSK